MLWNWPSNLHFLCEKGKGETVMETVGRKADRLCYLFLVFLTGCLVGWIYEEMFYWITEGMLRNRGILYGPWLPIYGVGALGIYAMKPLKRNPLVIFFLCAAVAGILACVFGTTGGCS